MTKHIVANPEHKSDAEIAREAAKRIYSGSLPRGVDPIDMITSDILAAITEAQQQLQKELERERMCHAACGVIAMSNTRESLSKSREMHPDYLSASVQDCIKAAEREIELREQLTEARQQNEDTARLFAFVTHGWFVDTREGDGQSTIYEVFDRAGKALGSNTDWRAAIDAARGAQPATKLTPQDFCRCGNHAPHLKGQCPQRGDGLPAAKQDDNHEPSHPACRRCQTAAKQEDAP